MSDSRKGGIGFFWLSAILGAGLAYFLDPQNGTRRRNMAIDQLGGLIRNSTGKSQSAAQYVAGQAYGVVQKTIPHPHDNPNPDDQTLRDRVESEVLRNPKWKQSDVIFNVVNGVVELRGELPRPQDIDELINRVKSVTDVKGVNSYLHLPHTVAPNKIDAVRAENS